MPKTFVFWLVSIVVLGCAASVGAQCGARTAEWAYGPTRTATGDGDVAVFSSGRVLQVADVTDPANPFVVGSTTVGDIIQGVAIEGEVAFVAAAKAGLVMVKISRPDRPKVVGSFDTSDWVQDLALMDDMAFLAAREDGLVIVDVSDPTTPTEIASMAFNRSVPDVTVHGDLAFVSNTDDGLQIVNVADPSSPQILSTLGGLGRIYANAVTADGQMVIAAEEFEGRYHLIDVSDPSAPVALGSIEVPSNAVDVAIDGQFAHLANRNYGMRIYDISNPGAPVEIQRIDPDGSNVAVAVHGDLAFMSNREAGLRLVDITVPGEAEELGFIEARPELYSSDIEGSLAVLAGGSSLFFLDLSQPTAPVEVSAIDPQAWAKAVVVDRDLMYLPDGSRGGLEIFDLTDPENPTLIGSVEGPNADDIAKEGDIVFLAGGWDGLTVVDVSIPTRPAVIATLTGFYSKAVVHSNGLLYMPEYSTGVHLIDVTTPSSPIEVGLIEITEVMGHPVVNGNTLYLGRSGYGILIFDNTNPLQPVQIGQIGAMGHPFGTVAIGHLIFVAGIYSGGFVYDVSNPAEPVLLATPELAATEEGEVTSEGSLVLVSEREGGAEIFDLGPCFSESPTADFKWRPANPEAGRPVRLTDTSFGTIATRSWDFGDGVTSSDRNPLHIWSEAGAYEVVLTVSGPRGSQSITRTVVVNPSSGGAPPITDPGEFAYVVAASAHAPGLANTRWVTDAVLHNPGSQAAEAYLWFMKDGQNNTGAEGVGVTVAAGTSVLIEDVVLSLFEEDNAAGAILVGSDQPLLVTSRTYNDAATGTYGQFIPGRELSSGVTRNETVHLIQLTRTSTFRTNMGVANPTPNSVSVGVSVRNAQGSEIKSRVLTVPPFGFTQQTDLLGTNADDALAVVSSSTSGASYFPYASVVDNRTGDPIMVEPIEPDNTLMIAAAAHVGGLAGTDWRTDLEVCNPQTGPAEIELALLATGQNNSSSPSVMLNVSAGSCTRVMDVLDASFSHEGTAALVVHENSLDLLASSRTFNTTDQGTFGQFLPGIAASGVLSSGEEARIVQLTQSTSDSTGFRTNLGFVNRSSSNITVDVELRASAGNLLGSIAVQLMPYEHRQINRVFRQVTSAPVNNGTATVSTSSGSFVAYASVVDNASGDPIYIPASPIGG